MRTLSCAYRELAIATFELSALAVIDEDQNPLAVDIGDAVPEATFDIARCSLHSCQQPPDLSEQAAQGNFCGS